MSSADDPESPGPTKRSPGPTNPPHTTPPPPGASAEAFLGASPGVSREASAEAFFGGGPVGLGALAWVESQVNDCGGAEMRVSKTQIGWARRRGFATLWSPRRAAGHGADWALTLHLSRRDGSPRWKEVTEVRPGLWAHHLELGEPGELDDQVARWLHEACANASDVLVMDPGPAAILVDEGRQGWAHLAITNSGAFDRPAYRLANRLVGNHPGSAAIEFLLGPITLRFQRRATIAITGIDADVALRRDDGQHTTVDTHSTVAVPAGSTITVNTARFGLRGYLAVRGGWNVAPVLGSRSRDTLAALGPNPLAVGAGLPIGTEAGPFPSADHAPRPRSRPHSRSTSTSAARPRSVGAAPPGTTEVLHLRLLPAPRSDALQLAPAELADLEWTVSPASDRIGVRLEGPSLRVTPQRHSEPLVRGAVQVPPSGQPVIMGPDHPTTGGYPVIGVVADADTDALAQARPGTRVRLTPDWG